MGIWGFEAAIDRSYPAAPGGPAGKTRSGFRSFLSRNFDRFRTGGTGRNLCSEPGLFLQSARISHSRFCREQKVEEERVMLGWVVTFLIVALIAGILGFGSVAGASIEIAKIIFFIAVVLFLVSAVVGLARGRTQV
jgi:uncharacterized membrane protein YtjA (UPF0391 family)